MERANIHTYSTFNDTQFSLIEEKCEYCKKKGVDLFECNKCKSSVCFTCRNYDACKKCKIDPETSKKCIIM
jgi:hypothetical protein